MSRRTRQLMRVALGVAAVATLGFTATAYAVDAPANGRAGAAPQMPLAATTGAGTTATQVWSGAYSGGNEQGWPNIQSYEGWMAESRPGYRVDAITVFTGDANWSDYDGSVGWIMAPQMFGRNRPFFWSVSTIPQGTTWTQASTAKVCKLNEANCTDSVFAEHWKKAARTVLGGPKLPNGKIIVRTGWEANGNWFWYKAHGQEAQFAATFRNFVTAFRNSQAGAADVLQFDFNYSMAFNEQANLEAMYPGNDYVDVISGDLYWSPGEYGQPTDGVDAWNYFLNHRFGLRYHEQFAANRGKPIAYPEWGVKGQQPHAVDFIHNFRAWMLSHNTVYQSYWDSDFNFQGQMRGRTDATARAYRSDFAPLAGGGVAPSQPPSSSGPPSQPSSSSQPPSSQPPSGSVLVKGVASNRCLTAPANNGAAAFIRDCTDQRWTVTAAGEIRSGNRCLEAFGQGTANGTVVGLWTCNGGANQKWTRTANGSFTGVQSRKCIDVKGEATANGTVVQLYTCHGGANQRWTLVA